MPEQDMPEKETQGESSAQEETQDETESVTSEQEESHPQAEPDQPEEAAAFSKLSGTAQDRFRSILQERNEYREKLDKLSQAQADREQIDQTHQAPIEDEVREAVRKLKEVGGVVTQDDLNNLWWAMQNTRTHDEYEKKYSGENGTPKYDRVEVEDYARRKGLGNNFLAAYREMYWDELTDATTASKRKPVYTEKPTANTDREQPLTLESLRKNLRGPKGREYYEKMAQNPEEFDKLLSQLTEE